MNDTTTALAFDEAHLGQRLAALDDTACDELDFGVIGFDAAGIVRRYNRFEAEAAGLSLDRVVGRALFTAVAPCMNNFMVAQRFEDALAAGRTLDATIDYVLTLRMKPERVTLRLIANPGARLAYVLVHRRAAAP